MNFERRLCVGIDGVELSDCNVVGHEVSVNMRSLMGSDELEVPWDDTFVVKLVIEGLQDTISSQEWELKVSGRECGNYSTAELRAGVGVTVVGSEATRSSLP